MASSISRGITTPTKKEAIPAAAEAVEVSKVAAPPMTIAVHLDVKLQRSSSLQLEKMVLNLKTLAQTKHLTKFIAKSLSAGPTAVTSPEVVEASRTEEAEEVAEDSSEAVETVEALNDAAEADNARNSQSPLIVILGTSKALPSLKRTFSTLMKK